jgi:hypothetical protein
MSFTVNVGVARKISRDFQSRGYSLNLEGEVLASASDPDKLIEEIKQFYDLAEEALELQVERSQGTSALAAHDEQPSEPTRSNGNGRSAAQENGRRSPPGDGNGRRDEPATNKQLQYLLSIGKRMPDGLGCHCDRLHHHQQWRLGHSRRVLRQSQDSPKHSHFEQGRHLLQVI